ncbi:MAG: hypothetical protein MJ184_11725 [Treponema sp.]|uniref:hypothetical protein n=1 Tax=Treponema sp. TaxID=166 RepID=UPI00298D8B5A|nr:hypothetical protein [Treponema sp.]MCQ2602018.1 hypothetical protein [Treponema sp.]
MDHSFNFDGGEFLSKMGASWFASYAYFLYKDPYHSNWKRVKTFSSRKSVFNNSKKYHSSWLVEILHMDSMKLITNEINLTSIQVKYMAVRVLEFIAPDLLLEECEKEDFIKQLFLETPENIFSKKDVINNSNIDKQDNSKKKIKSLPDKTDKELIEIVIAKRSMAVFNNMIKFQLSDGSVVLTEEKGMDNNALPWPDREVKLFVYSKIDPLNKKERSLSSLSNNYVIYTDWRWEYHISEKEGDA